jgi:outer membrane protein OmpA-like peptidoglycan-associated protein
MSIQFDFDSAHIRTESLPALQNLAGALGSPQLQEAKIRIEGHTDAKGRSDYNLRLSTQRAEAVSRWLIQQGISESRLQAVGLGSTQPADPDPQAAANRRVRIVNLQ